MRNSIYRNSFFYFLLLYTTQLYSTQCNAQVLNMDRVTAPADSVKKWQATVSAGMDFNSDKRVFDWDMKADVTRFLSRKHILLAIFKNDFTSTAGNDLQNAGYLHLRFRDNDSRKLSPEYFTQYQWDDLRGMLDRYLLGCNLRWMIKETGTLDIYAGLGLMYEWEKWNYNGVEPDKLPSVYPPLVRTHLLKLNQYLKLSCKLFKTTDLTFTNFIQTPAGKDFIYPRVADFLQWNIAVTRKFSINLDFESIYDAKPIVPIKYFYYNYTTGFALTM